MFQDITSRYDLTDATWEIVLMLLGAFILGYLLRYFWRLSKSGGHIERIQQLEGNLTGAQEEKDQLKLELAAYREKFEAQLPKPEDLKVVEGIGPKIESLLKNAGINTWQELADTDINKIQGVLKDAGDRYRIHNPATWPKQAGLAAAGKWRDLDQLKDSLTAGRN